MFLCQVFLLLSRLFIAALWSSAAMLLHVVYMKEPITYIINREGTEATLFLFFYEQLNLSCAYHNMNDIDNWQLLC